MIDKGECVEHIIFSDRGDIDNFGQGGVDNELPDKKIYERHLIKMFLRRVFVTIWNKFPLELIHDDRPDFHFKESNRWVGIEVTRACDQTQKEAMSRFNSRNQSYCYSTNSFSPFIPKKKPRELVNAISSGDEAPVRPLMGDEPERRWAAYIQQAMYKKKSDFNKADFKKFSENILLVNVETPGMVAVRDFEVALNYLEAELFDFWHGQATFDTVFIFHDDVLIELDSTSVVMH